MCGHIFPSHLTGASIETDAVASQVNVQVQLPCHMYNTILLYQLPSIQLLKLLSQSPLKEKKNFCLSMSCAHSSLPSLMIASLVKLVIYSSLCNEIICTIVQVNGDEAQKSFVTE